MQSKIHKDENRGGSTACAGRTRTRSGVGGGSGRPLHRQELVSKVYTSSRCSSIPKEHTPRQKWAGGRHRQFSKEDTQMAKRQMKRCLTALIIREMQIKTTMRYYPTWVRMAIIKKYTNNKGWREGNPPTLLVGT